MKNILLAHNNEDPRAVEKLRDIFSRAGLAVREHTGTATNETKQNAEGDIDWADLIVVLITKTIKHCEWVYPLIENAAWQERWIIGAYADNSNEINLPKSFIKYYQCIVRLVEHCVLDAIHGRKTGHYPDEDCAKPRPLLDIQHLNGKGC